MARSDEQKRRPAESGGKPVRPVAVRGGGTAVTPPSAAAVSASALLAAESKVRKAANEIELLHAIANELRALLTARQVIVLRLRRPLMPEIACVSSLVLADRETPFVRWMEALVTRVLADPQGREGAAFALPDFTDPQAAETNAYPFPNLVWQPMRLVDGEMFAGVVAARELPWTDQERRILARQADVFATNWQALHGATPLRPRKVTSRRLRLAIAAALIAGALLPVPMTTLATVEIVAARPQRVTAPLDGVVQEILVDPNRPVTLGQPILRFDETTLRNRLHVAEQERELARSRYERAQQAAFGDDKARHELAQAGAELALKSAERDYAADLLARCVIRAERAGILVYTDKDRWIGRPVRTGERIMQIVDPRDVAARIELPVADAIVLSQRASVRLFLDANPLSAVRATLVSEGYQAEPNSTQHLVYRLHATLDDSHDGVRIGARGTAQLQGSLVPIVFYLLRRPLSAARQHIGF